MRKIILSLLLIFTAFSCENEIYSTIPNAPVSYKLNLNLYVSDHQLNAGTGAYLKITQKRLDTDRLGFGGLLIINGVGLEPVNLFAYDLACPVEANRNALIVPEDINETGTPTAFTAKCQKCGAVYDIIGGFGTPKSGSKYYLRTYRVMKTANSGEYIVTN